MEDNSKDENFLNDNNNDLSKVAELNESDVNLTEELEKNNLNEEIVENVGQQIFDDKDSDNFQNFHDKQISELDLDSIENVGETVPVKHLETMTNVLANDEITNDDLEINLNMNDDIIDNQTNIDKNITGGYQNFHDKQISELDINEKTASKSTDNTGSGDNVLKKENEIENSYISVGEGDTNTKVEELQSDTEKNNNSNSGDELQSGNHDLTPDILVQDLETINDDFVQEFEEKKEKQLLEEKKKAEIEAEEHKEENVKLMPIVEEEKNKNDLANLNLDNIEEFLKKNSKNIENDKNEKMTNEADSADIYKEEIKEDEQELIEVNNNEDEKYNKDIIKDIKLNEELWDELNLSEDLKNKIKIRVRMEIKTFLRDNLIPIMEKIIRRI